MRAAAFDSQCLRCARSELLKVAHGQLREIRAAAVGGMPKRGRGLARAAVRRA